MDKKKSGAKPKYDTPTIMVSFRCPENKVVDFKDKVRAILESYSNLFKGEVSGFVKIQKKTAKKVIDIQEKQKVVPMYGETFDFKNECDCYLDDDGLLRKAKNSTCKKNKSQHNF